MTDLEFGRPLRGEAAEVLWERIESRVQSRPKRCTAQLFAGPEYRCHRDAGHADAHIHYNEHNDGLAGWRNEGTE